MATSRPNILYVMSDDHTVDAINCYGGWLNDVVDTPNLDRIANEGMRFTNCFCNNSLCSPSRASIITGQYSHKNGVLRLNGSLAEDHPSFARQLQADGYQTAVVGKWHLKTDPVGFDHYEILPGQGNYFNLHFNRNGQTTFYQGYATDIITDLSLDWLKERDTSRPFMMLTHHKAPHGMWEFAPRHAEMFMEEDLPEPENLYQRFEKASGAFQNYWRDVIFQAKRMDEGFNGRTWPTGRLDTTGMTEKEKIHAGFQKYVKDYLRCIAAIDESVGRLLAYLDEEGLVEDTIVVYTSDQGMFLGEHSFVDKRLILEEALRMPLLMRYPGTIQPGSVNDDMVMNIDFAETIVDFAGLEADPRMQGQSFRPLCEGKEVEWRKSMFYGYWDGVAMHHGVRDERYKLAVHCTGEKDLFDLEVDPLEMTSQVGNEEYADVLVRMETELDRLIEEVDISPRELPGRLQDD